jgi:hypothetical protein
VPSWQVFADNGAATYPAPDRPTGKKAMCQLQTGMKAQLIRNHAYKSAISYRLTEQIYIIERVRKRLFDQQMASCLCGPQRNRHMQAGWIADQGGIRAIRERRVQIGE